jgi:hypothetical protein
MLRMMKPNGSVARKTPFCSNKENKDCLGWQAVSMHLEASVIPNEKKCFLLVYHKRVSIQHQKEKTRIIKITKR